MDQSKKIIKDLKLVVSEAHMMGEELSGYALQKIYQKLKDIENDIETYELNNMVKKSDEIIDIPKLPKGDKYNGFPRITYAIVCEFYSRNKFFSVYDLMDKTGSSRTQAKADLERLKKDGFIEIVEKQTIGKTNLYKYKPTRL